MQQRCQCQPVNGSSDLASINRQNQCDDIAQQLGSCAACTDGQRRAIDRVTLHTNQHLGYRRAGHFLDKEPARSCHAGSRIGQLIRHQRQAHKAGLAFMGMSQAL